MAIEIASSKIKGALGGVGPDGSLTVLAVEEIPGTNNVRYGRIQNIREVSSAVNEIVRRLEATPGVAPRKIEAMSISLGGRSLTAVPAHAALKSPHECEITESHVQRLMYEATRDFMGDKNIEATVPRTYYVNNAKAPKPVGTFGETLRGEFMMLTCGKETRQNLDRLKFDTVDHDNVVYEIRPIAIADFILSADERELGCALVDFGAETTTVSVYKDGTLAFLSTIPMGSRLITLDLMAGLGITEEAAESYKLTLGTVGDVDRRRDNNPNAEEVNEYVRARAGEIAANILNQIELSGYNAETLSTVVLTGGGSKLPEFAQLLGAQCKMPVRVAEMPVGVTFRTAGRNNADNIDIVSLLMAGVRRPQFSCLSALPVQQAPVADEDEDESPEEEYQEPVRETASRTRREEAPVRRTPTEDDDDLLEDDRDDDEYPEEDEDDRQGRKGRGFFGFGRKKKQRVEPEEEPYEEDETDSFRVDEEAEEEPEEDPQPDDDPDRYKKTTEQLNTIGKIFMKIFKSSPEDEEDDE